MEIRKDSKEKDLFFFCCLFIMCFECKIALGGALRKTKK